MATLSDALAAAQAYSATASVTRAQYDDSRDIVPGSPNAAADLAPYIALPSALWAQAIIDFLTLSSISQRILAYNDAFNLELTPLPNALLSDTDLSSDLINFGNFSNTLKWTIEDFIQIFIDNESEINALVTADPADPDEAEADPDTQEPAPDNPNTGSDTSCQQTVVININPNAASYVINIGPSS